VQVRDSNGNPLSDYSVPLREGQPLPRLPDDAAYLAAHANTPFTVPAASGGGHWRVLAEPVPDSSGRMLVVAGVLDNIDSTIGRLRAIDLFVSAGVLLILVGVAVAIVRRSLRPLVEIEQTAAAIAAGQLSRRVPDRDLRTEVGRLGGALNSMLAQIESAFRARAASEAAARGSEERMRRFVADASHELRTPLTTIRGFAELYRQGASRQPAELDRLMRRIEEQAVRMGLLVEDLLLLARLDQQRPIERRPVDLRPRRDDRSDIGADAQAKQLLPMRQRHRRLAGDIGRQVVEQVGEHRTGHRRVHHPHRPAVAADDTAEQRVQAVPADRLDHQEQPGDKDQQPPGEQAPRQRRGGAQVGDRQQQARGVGQPDRRHGQGAAGSSTRAASASITGVSSTAVVSRFRNIVVADAKATQSRNSAGRLPAAGDPPQRQHQRPARPPPPGPARPGASGHPSQIASTIHQPSADEQPPA
jgi:signal transduction histidine kinase